MNRIVAGLMLALSVCLVQGSDEDFTELRNTIIRESKCLEKEGLKMEEVQTFSMGDNLEELDTKPQLRCFAACLFEHSGIMDNCVINKETFANDDMLKGLHNVLMNCTHASEAGDRCECAYQLSKCIDEMW